MMMMMMFVCFLQLGIAIGFLFPPMLVPSSDDISVIGQGFQLMFYIVAACTSVIFVLILLCKNTLNDKPFLTLTYKAA
jgi:hypothetical protein